MNTQESSEQPVPRSVRQVVTGSVFFERRAPPRSPPGATAPARSPHAASPPAPPSPRSGSCSPGPAPPPVWTRASLSAAPSRAARSARCARSRPPPPPA
eukprot:4443209-Pyramimonas_sp.AAC.1